MLIPYLMKVSLVLAVLALAYRWLIQFETFSKLNRVLLWLNVVAAWTLPLISLPGWGPVEVQTGFHHSIPKVVNKLPLLEQQIAAIQTEAFKTQPGVATTPVMTFTDWLTAIYLAGMIVMAAYFLFQISRLLIVVAKGRDEECAGGTSIVRVAGTSPYSFFKWIVLDPSKHSAPELRNIVAHEAEHARQWHSADLLLAEIQRICLWFNPFAWVHQKLVQENLEYLADRAVLDNGIEKKQYQYNLLNTALRTRELPLTNSFAQSLLKKRIKMMNRKPSHYLVWGKYIAVIALIYISSAFVAPYREQIVELAPEVIRPLVKPLLGEVIAPVKPVKDSVDVEKEQASPVPLHAKLASELPDTIQTSQEPKVKGILIRNGTLYWAINPLMTWEDINAMRNAVREFGAVLAINKIQYDPLQQFITSVSVVVSYGRKSSAGSGSSDEKGEHDETIPLKGYSGYIQLNGLGMGQPPPSPLLEEVNAGYEKALEIRKQNEVTYFEYRLSKSIGSQSSISFSPETLQGAIGEKNADEIGISKSADNKLRISDYHKNSTFYLNTNTSTFTELNEVLFSKVQRITLMEDNARRKYIVVYAQ